jgi:hypothetical protein
MKISASQDETFTRCKRNWWFAYPQRLPSIPKGDLDFGSVIHNVCERFLLADDTGRDKDGNPVELFPDGWDSIEDKKGKRSISPAQSDLIRKLVAKAIEEGVLERRPGRTVEQWFSRDLIPGVKMVGKIDMLLPGEVQDHKSTKAMKWAKNEKKDSPNYLGKSLQMLDYAHEALVADPSLEVVRLRHNVFCKDPEQPIVRKVDVSVTKAQVMSNWQRLMKAAWEMQVLTKQNLKEDQWSDVPGPSEPDACEAYGGCPYVRICGGVDTPDQYRKRVTKQIKNKENHQETFTWEESWGKLGAPEPESANMDIFSKSKARQKAKKAGKTASSEPAPAVKPIDGSVAVAEEEVAVDLSAGVAPPWAQPKCPACKGAGFNKKGSPCRICDATSKKAGGRTSLEFVVESDGDGNLVWEAKDGSMSGISPLTVTTGEVKAQEKMELPEAPLDTPDTTEVPEENIMAAIDKAGVEAAEDAEEKVSKEVAKKADKVLPEKKEKKTRKPRKPRKPKAKAEEPAPESEPETAPSVVNTENPDEVPTAEEVTAPTPPKSKGRPKTGYYLYIDCIPIGVETTAIEGIFADMAAELAAEMSVESYFDLDVYKRREAFARALTADILQERFNKMHIIARNPQGAPDLRAFVDAIVSVSPKGRVIQGVK